MIIDIVQKSTHVDISHSTKEGKIVVTSVPLPENGYENWVICSENDPDKDPVFRNFKGEPVKRLPGARFWDLNLNEFVSKRLSPELDESIHSNYVPEMFSVDIETEIKDEFPGAEEAKTRILVFTITAPNMATLVLSLKEKAHEIDDSKVSQYIEEAMDKLEWGKQLRPSNGWQWVNQVFDTEGEMITYFLDLMRTTMGYIGGWNFHAYDWKYITNRCSKLGIDLGRSSPEHEIDREGYPIHRIVHDYMHQYQRSAYDYENESFSLDAVSQWELGIGKLDYGGLGLKELYEQDYSKYIAYAIVDTALVQLIHKKTARSEWVFAFGEYLRIGVKQANGSLAQADALCFEDMYVNNVVYGVQKQSVEKEPYEGGFVKNPVRKYCDYPVGYDAKALYPNTMRSLNLSFENYIGKAANDTEAKAYLQKGYIVTERNNVYKNDKDYMYKRIQEKLANQRAQFQNLQNDIWTNALSVLDSEAERRGIKLKKHDS
ncbi:gp105 [Sphingomonas phage PAU]|uniref:DNA polymerase n=1 Tax=Sphingomonas phage PAU TaxID=1150991 RepID=UPI000257325C|nr:DNA polymerase [Sphingomonas phage PAU]AFF28103.1 gp105 [Sphingomonas phage PAU]